MVLGLGGLGLARLVDAGANGIGLTWAAGCALLAVAALYRLRESSHWSGRGRAQPASEDAAREEWWRTLGRAAYPSTIGLTILTGIALPIEGVLAALLAGMLAGLGVAALVLAGEQALWEQQAGRTIDSAPSRPPRYYSRPRKRGLLR